MAPELIQGHEYTQKVDIWSLGVMMVECAEKDPPYFEEDPVRVCITFCNKMAQFFNKTKRLFLES